MEGGFGDERFVGEERYLTDAWEFGSDANGNGVLCDDAEDAEDRSFGLFHSKPEVDAILRRGKLGDS